MAKNFIYFCKEKNDLGRTNDVKGSSFKCELCEKRLVYIKDAQGQRLGEHGKTVKTIGHELRQMDEPIK